MRSRFRGASRGGGIDHSGEDAKIQVGSRNLDHRVVKSFGEEWSRFDNQRLEVDELEEMFSFYTSVFPWEDLPDGSEGFDAGCGSGRWARFFAPRVGRLHCIDASEAALEVARTALARETNVEFRHEALSSIGLEDASCDFGYALGVLHHIPDTERAVAACAAKLKPGAPFLVYLYHDLEDRTWLNRLLLRAVTVVKRPLTHKAPHPFLVTVFCNVVVQFDLPVRCAVVAYYRFVICIDWVKPEAETGGGLHPPHYCLWREVSKSASLLRKARRRCGPRGDPARRLTKDVVRVRGRSFGRHGALLLGKVETK